MKGGHCPSFSLCPSARFFQIGIEINEFTISIQYLSLFDLFDNPGGLNLEAPDVAEPPGG